mgnify:CR=1 FL=1
MLWLLPSHTLMLNNLILSPAMFCMLTFHHVFLFPSLQRSTTIQILVLLKILMVPIILLLEYPFTVDSVFLLCIWYCFAILLCIISFAWRRSMFLSLIVHFSMKFLYSSMIHDVVWLGFMHIFIRFMNLLLSLALQFVK